MAYKITNKQFQKKLLENKAYKIRIAHEMLENESYREYGNSYDQLGKKEKGEIALKVAKEYNY